MKVKEFYRFLNPKFQKLFLEYKVDFKPRYGYGKPAHQDLLRIIDANRHQYKDILNKALAYKEAIWTIRDSELSQKIEPIWNHPNIEKVEKHGCSFWLRTK